MRTLNFNNSTLLVAQDRDELMLALAESVASQANEATESRGCFSLALSGGSTPQALYSLLSTRHFRSRIPWSKVHVFVGDERCVGACDPQNNFAMIDERLLSKVPIPRANVHPTSGQENDPAQAASNYENDLRGFFEHRANGFPQFDLILLGLGTDGHTASLFPETEALQEKVRWVVDNWVPKLGSCRITVTLPVLNHARRVVFLVSGSDKEEILTQVMTVRSQPEHQRYPAQLVHPSSGRLEWFVDKAAAGRIADIAGSD